jgi:cyclopropane-fatty-acyl-phospholipid synthase
MNEFVLTSPGRRGAALDPRGFPAAARFVLPLLERLQYGRLAVTFPDGQRAEFGRGGQGEPHADIRLANWNVCGAALKSGDIGFAESYVAGDWASSDLARLLAFFIRNRDAADTVIYGSFWGQLAYRIKHWLNRNTRAKAKKNITAHYDLGNAFYSLWLDPSMTYSSALLDAVDDPHVPLQEAELQRAQQAKYQRALDELRLAPGSRVLEIGCGWGGFAEVAARAGHQVCGLTLSPSQLEHARMRLARAALAADLRLQDYRDEQAAYDGIASIEMFEAVGEEYWPSYFATLARCLTPGGRACIQTIVIDDRLFDRYRRSTDFIQQYIFPGGMLPSRSVFAQHAEAAGLTIERSHAFGRAYARTLASWRSLFLARLDGVRALGFDTRFIRIWEFYLAYCEAAFAQGSTDVVQFTLLKR